MPTTKRSVSALFFVSALLLSFSFPAYSKAPVYPDWYTDEGLEEVFPSSQYIREKGEGKTKQDAENEAVSYISRYFETEASISSVSTVNAVQSDGKTSITETTDIRNAVSSNMKLFGVKYTEAFYDKKAKTYATVAYIDITDAWNRYEGEVAASRDEFMAYYEGAQKEAEPVNRIRLYREALLHGKDFEEKLGFANALSKRNTKRTFGGDMQVLSSLPSLIKKEQISNPVYISVSDDSSGLIEAALRKAFTGAGFLVTASKGSGPYTAKTEVRFNKAPGSSMVVMSPFLLLSLVGKNGSVYAFSAECDRVVAPNEAAAKKLAAKDLAEKIELSLEKDMKENLGL